MVKASYGCMDKRTIIELALDAVTDASQGIEKGWSAHVLEPILH